MPPWRPDTPGVRADRARHYDNIAFAERHVADVMDRLRADGLLDETIVIVTTDHGDGLPRAKRTLYESGLKVPLMIRWPDGRASGKFEERLVSFVDLAPTILRLTGRPVPEWIQGRDLLDGDRRTYVFAASDRFDEVAGRRKAVRDDRFKYIRNYSPERPVLYPLNFRDAQPTMQEIWRLHAENALPAAIAQWLVVPSPAEELYDLKADPEEIDNLADDPAYAEERARLRGALDEWIARTGDLSVIPEIEMIEHMWPGRVQPVTAPPKIEIAGDALRLSSATAGASIAYSLDGGDPAAGKVYSGPVSLPAGTSSISAQAIRYGYLPSEVTVRRRRE